LQLHKKASAAASEEIITRCEDHSLTLGSKMDEFILRAHPR
jgi:hypothetical protein